MLRILAMAASAAQFAGFSKWAFGCGHLGIAVAQIKPVTYRPLFFSLSEYELVERLADIIIPSDGTPGAHEAGVAEFIDFMVSSDPSVQARFRNGLDWMNAQAGKLYGDSFLRLTPDQQVSMVEELAYKAKYRPGEEQGRNFFGLMRELVVMGFYTSEIGFKELDNPALKFYSDSPECPHRDDPEHLNLNSSH